MTEEERVQERARNALGKHFKDSYRLDGTCQPHSANCHKLPEFFYRSS